MAIIIPIRDREEHLRLLLAHMHPFLQKQQLNYGIYVIEQVPVLLVLPLTVGLSIISSQYSKMQGMLPHGAQRIFFFSDMDKR